ncbi:MAG: hypothetical protein AB1679_35025 [Actinomycetota bacterium]
MTVAQPPVFVDDTGRRRILTRRAGRIVVIGFTAYLGLVALGFARDPRVGPIHLPTFGLPSLGLMIPPAPTVLGEQATRTYSEAEGDSGPAAPRPDGEAGPQGSGPAPGGTATPPATPPAGVTSPAGVTPAATPAGRPAAPGKAPTSSTTAPPSSTSSTSTTSSSTSTTSTTTSSTTSTMPGAGQGQGQGQGQANGPTSAKGPDGSGAPGQARKTTTTTAS